MLKSMDGGCLFLKGGDGGNCPFKMSWNILGV